MNPETERALAAAGERWRAGQPPPPDVDLSRLMEPVRAGRVRAWAPLAAVAGVAAVLAVVVLPVALGRSGDGETQPGSGPPSDAATSGPVVPPGEGAPVEGIGALLREADGTTKLCAGVAVLTSLPPAGAGCSPVFVLVTGVEESWFTEEATTGQRWSQSVRVEGSYGGGVLAVTRVEPFTPDAPPLVETPVPCQPPAGGWGPGDGGPPGDFTAFNALAEHVRGNPDRFTDVWVGYPDGVPTSDATAARMVYVVGTTGDVDQARAELAALYPGNLCVHKVAHSAAELTAIANQLQSVSATPIQAEALVIENKVRVKVIALDPATSAILDAAGRDALIIDEPLLNWLD